MPMTFSYSVDVGWDIRRVWEAYQDMQTLLPALTDPGQQMRLERVEPLPAQVGTELVISTQSPIGRVKWVARIVENVPPHATITGTEARFVDEQIEGPFKSWRHTHEFEAIDDRSTRIIDHIDYRVGNGPLGPIANLLVVRPALKKMFAYRRKVLERMMGKVVTRGS
jgi:ligand-binding SRPBCC domain-containing protein